MTLCFKTKILPFIVTLTPKLDSKALLVSRVILKLAGMSFSNRFLADFSG